jgi:hypothetical protein
MEKMIRLAFLCIVVLFAFAGIAEASGKCGPNAYVDEITESEDERTIVCACVPGFEYQGKSCERVIPESVMDYFTLFTLQTSSGEVALYVERDGRKFPVSPARMFYANVVAIGATGQMTAFLDNEMRLRISANTELRLGELIPGDMLSIESLKGMIRLDNHLKPEDEAWVRKQLSKVKAWVKKARSRRLTIRGNVAMAVRGTDFTLQGMDDGSITMHLLDGKIDMEELISGEKISLGKGNKVLISPDGSMLRKIK